MSQRSRYTYSDEASQYSYGLAPKENILGRGPKDIWVRSPMDARHNCVERPYDYYGVDTRHYPTPNVGGAWGYVKVGDPMYGIVNPKEKKAKNGVPVQKPKCGGGPSCTCDTSNKTGAQATVCGRCVVSYKCGESYLAPGLLYF